MPSLSNPCNECGSTRRKHNGGCSHERSAHAGYGPGLTGKPKTCGATTRKAGRLPHLEHKCPLKLLTGGRPHPGSHICNVTRCEVAWY